MTTYDMARFLQALNTEANRLKDALDRPDVTPHEALEACGRVLDYVGLLTQHIVEGDRMAAMRLNGYA